MIKAGKLRAILTECGEDTLVTFTINDVLYEAEQVYTNKVYLSESGEFSKSNKTCNIVLVGAEQNNDNNILDDLHNLEAENIEINAEEDV